MGTLDRGNGTAPLCLTEFVTPKDGGGSTEAAANANLTLIFGCKVTDREMFGHDILRNNQQYSDKLFLPGMTSDFGAF